MLQGFSSSIMPQHAHKLLDWSHLQTICCIFLHCTTQFLHLFWKTSATLHSYKTIFLWLHTTSFQPSLKEEGCPKLHWLPFLRCPWTRWGPSWAEKESNWIASCTAPALQLFPAKSNCSCLQHSSPYCPMCRPASNPGNPSTLTSLTPMATLRCGSCFLNLHDNCLSQHATSFGVIISLGHHLFPLIPYRATVNLELLPEKWVVNNFSPCLSLICVSYTVIFGQNSEQGLWDRTGSPPHPEFQLSQQLQW